jgi:hypothetical protein
VSAKRYSPRSVLVSLVAAALLCGGCSATGQTPSGAGGGGGGAGVGGGSGGSPDDLIMLGSPTDPATCDAAAGAHSYLGCDYWPTVTFNAVWSTFDFAVVIANVGAEPADVNVSGPQGMIVTTTVQPRNVAKIALPWVPELKGPEFDTCSNETAPKASVTAKKAAYHITSSRPVIAYQFNALEYSGKGGPTGKDWSSCPGLQTCTPAQGTPGPIGCFSFSNDASILLPTTAMTGNYRIPALDDAGGSAFFAVTGTQDGTTVKLHLGSKASVLPGGPIKSSGAKTVTFTLDAGDVVEVASDGSSDLGGGLVQADKPVQVLVGSSCASIAQAGTKGATCDHLEESVQPAETLGQHYLVAAPTGPLGAPNPYRIRLFGNVDGTTLSYPAGAPKGAPTTINAGEVADLGIQQGDLEIVGDHELAVATFLVSSIVANPDDIHQHGDPSQSQPTSVEQFRKSYVFLAPDDYDVSFIDVIVPTGAAVKLDNAPLPGTPTPIGTSGFGVARVRLGEGDAGAHTLESDKPVGVQVIGYGAYTSYQYPAGLDLAEIAPPPPK